MARKYAHIGVFDSGVGGLFVLEAIRIHPNLKKYDVVYYGDTANMPYGSKSADEVYTLTVNGVEKLLKGGAIVVVLACNTASALALRRIQQTWLPKHYPDRKVLGVVIPAIESAIEAGDKEITVLATPATICSHVYKTEITKFHAKVHVREVAVPYAAQLIESGAMVYAEALLTFAIMGTKQKSGAVLLGCTHFEAVAEELSITFPKLHIVSQGSMVAEKLADYLHRHDELCLVLSMNGGCAIVKSKLRIR